MLKFKLLLAAVGLTLTWVFVVPIFEFPDEQAHFGTVNFLLQEGRVPVGLESDLTLEMRQAQEILGVFRNGLGQNKYTYHPEYRIEYTDSFVGKYENVIKSLNQPEYRHSYEGVEAARYPSLYYRLIGFFTELVNQHDLIIRLFVGRLGGLLLAASLFYATYLLGIEIFKKTPLALTLAILTLFQPMMSFVTAGINSDNLHNLLFTLILLFTSRVITTGFSVTTIFGLMASTALDIYTKPQGIIALPLIVLAILLSLIKSKHWRSALFFLPLLSVVLYLTKAEWSKYLGFVTFGNPLGLSFIEYLRFASNKLLTQNVVWYWGVFKWLGVVLPPIYWQVANRVVLLSTLGIIVYLIKVLKKKAVVIDTYLLIYVMAVAFIYAATIFWFDWLHVKAVGYSLGIQARYFFPTIVAHMALLMTGILSLGWNQKVTEWLRRGLIFLFVWLQLGGIWRLLTSYYDTSSVNSLIIQMSQYKPDFTKGNWWYLWFTVFVLSLSYLLKTSLTVHTFDKDKPRDMKPRNKER